MNKRILILFSIIVVFISACNSGNSSSSAAPKTPKSIAGDPTPAPSPSTSPYFPDTSASYKSLAVMRVYNDNTMYSQYDYVEVGANGTAFLGQAYISQGTKTPVTNWRRLNFPGASGDFTQVIGCNSDENGTTFIAVGNNGEAYIITDYNGNITSSKVAGISNNVSLVGATCINSTDQNSHEETTSVIFAGNRPDAAGSGANVIMIYKGELISTGGSGYQIFNIVPSIVGLQNNPRSGQVYAIASDNKQNIAVAANSGYVLLSSDAGQSWLAYANGRNEIIRSIAFNPKTSDFVYGGSLSFGALNNSGFTLSIPLSSIINGVSYDDAYGINSVVCGEFNCLLSGVDEVQNTSQDKAYMIILNSNSYQLSGVKNQQFGGKNSDIAASQLVLVNDGDDKLAAYYALDDNQIYAQDIDSNSVSYLWTKVATLPAISQ